MDRCRDARTKIELGDFQTPPGLARTVCQVLVARGLAPRTIVEPTCGTGSLLQAALEAFPGADRVLGADINPEHVAAARTRLGSHAGNTCVTLEQLNFFTADWESRIAAPVLCIGNPPWVTSSDLGALGSVNLPDKSNFDISEWMLIQLLAWLVNHDAALAMLCKTSVARRVLEFSWRVGIPLQAASIYRIDSRAHFAVAVDACLLACELGPTPRSLEGKLSCCEVFDALDVSSPRGEFGSVDGHLVADLGRYRRWRHLIGEPSPWRSGIKHDCAAVMELRRVGERLHNGLGEVVEIEGLWIFLAPETAD